MSSLANFVWGIADQLRGVYKPHQYGNVILPMTILRRLDALMAESRDRMRELAEAHDNPNVLAAKIRKECGLGFYNTSEFDLARLVADPDSLSANLVDYISRFSPNIDVFERFKFENEITTLDEKNRLVLIVRQFAEVDLHPDTVPNAAMGDLFEELIRKFAEASNEEAGEHFTPRDAIRLMVELLFAEDNEALTQGAVVRTVYDPTAGTGGMLSVAEDHLIGSPEKPGLNPDARLVMFGQEINDQSYAICKSDMIAKGQDATNIRLGDTLANDLFAEKTFDYCMSNPPYGVDWKASVEAIKAERAATGAHGRFAPGLPKIGDGQMLFLTHLAHKMRPVHEGGGRAGIVLNGSPLFNGGAESGESEIRRHLLENDLVEAIVALPTNMFYNTGISTYIWILDNTKRPERVGKVQLIDGSGFYTKMRKNLGDKSREVSEADRARILAIYDAYDEQAPEDADHSRIFDTTDFGYWTVTVEQPLRLNFCGARAQATADALVEPVPTASGIMRGYAAFMALGEKVYKNREEFLAALKIETTARGITFSAPEMKAIVVLLAERDETADICTDRKGHPESDSSLRDTENIPFGWAPPGEMGDSRYGETHREEVIKAYFEHEVAPHVPDAQIDHAKTKTGYEVPFTRHFYKYVPPRPLEEIDADLDVLVKEIMGLLREVEA
ncbi:MAG: type I restriction-modification system subunit M [Nocardioidaceae bacterium]